MQKYFLLTILFVTIILGCGKNSDPELEPRLGISFDGGHLIVNDYLSKKDLELYTNHIIVKDLFFYAYGFKDNKLYIKGFNIHTKQNIWSFVSKTNFPIGNTITINEGYGIIKTHKVTGFNIMEILKYENNYVLVLYNLLDADNGGGFFSNLFTVSNGNEFLIDTKIINFETHLLKWFENSFLLYYNNHYEPSPNNIIQCYSYSGNLLYETQNTNNYLKLYSHFVLNSDECIIYYPGNSFRRFNVKEDKEIWRSGQPLKDLPANIRIDKTTFEVIDKDFTKCTFNYTLFEGDKKIIAFKINNSTGEFVQL